MEKLDLCHLFPVVERRVLSDLIGRTIVFVLTGVTSDLQIERLETVIIVPDFRERMCGRTACVVSITPNTFVSNCSRMSETLVRMDEYEHER